jgi:tetratricopeptide (TPR) repeat protein
LGNGPARPWAAVVVAVLVSALFGLIACTADSETGGADPKDAYYNLMVGGWLQGKTSLSLDAPAGLQALANPYDPKANAQYRGSMFYPPRVHDLSYFRGKLYAYFSPVPALVAFLPFHVLTGRWLSHQQACLFFCLVQFYAAVALLWLVRGLFFRSVGDGWIATAVLALGFLSVAPILLQRPDAWEVPLACAQAGWMLVLLSVLWIWLRPCAGWPPFLIAGVSAAMAAGSRPSSALCGALLLLPACGLLGANREGATARRAGYLAALALPSIVLGGALLAFNKARFGEWLEFGQKYQLNGDAIRHASSGYFSLSYLTYNLKLYAFNYRGWSQHFPFIGDFRFPPAPPGYGWGDHPFGMILQMPAMLFSLGLIYSWWRVPRVQRRDYSAVVAMVAYAGLATAVPLLMFFSACIRYQYEFAMYPAVLSVLGFLGAEASASGWIRAAVRVTWCVALAASIAFCLLFDVSLRARTLMTHGNIDFSLGNIEEAAGHYGGALSLEPDLVAARAMLGVIHIRKGDFGSAAKDYARAVEDNPDSATLLANLGYCLIRLGRLDEAIRPLTRAVELKPDDTQMARLLRLARQREAEEARDAGK